MNDSLHRTLVTVAALCLLLAGCAPGTPEATGWQETVDALASLQSQPIPEHLLQDNPSRTGEEFDVHAYFTVLDHLSMEPGYVLDYVYWYDFMGGFPILYARPADQPPYRTFSEYETAAGAQDRDALFQGYLDRVQVDDTAAGFFQLVVLHIMGRQFYLHWHASYNDATVICNQEALERVLSATEFGAEIPEDVKDQARAIDVTPVVELGSDTALVKVVTFTKWGGFFRQTYTFRRQFPHTLLESTKENLVPYDCGVMF